MGASGFAGGASGFAGGADDFAGGADDLADGAGDGRGAATVGVGLIGVVTTGAGMSIVIDSSTITGGVRASVANGACGPA